MQKVLAILLPALLALSLAGCGGGEPAESEAPASGAPASSAAESEPAESEAAESEAAESSAPAESEAPVESESPAESEAPVASEAPAAGEATASQPPAAAASGDAAAYLTQVEGLNQAAADFALELINAMGVSDAAQLPAALETVRATKQPFVEFAAVTPPAGYEAAHPALADASARFADFIDRYVDLLQGALDGSVDPTSEEYAQQGAAMTAAMEQIGAAQGGVTQAV